MNIPTQIVFRHMDASEALTLAIERQAEHLEEASIAVASCRVVVDAPSRHHAKGDLFRVRVELRPAHAHRVPVARRELMCVDPDPYRAVREAFALARRRLADGAHGHGRPAGRGASTTLRLQALTRGAR